MQKFYLRYLQNVGKSPAIEIGSVIVFLKALCAIQRDRK